MGWATSFLSNASGHPAAAKSRSSRLGVDVVDGLVHRPEEEPGKLDAFQEPDLRFRTDLKPPEKWGNYRPAAGVNVMIV
jgi:hypothetical protein